MFDVFVYLIEHFQNLNACPERLSLEEKLEDAGFEEDEITQAFSWMDKITLVQTKPNPHLLNSNGFRVFSPNEILYLSDDILNLLSFLTAHKIINNCQRELIIDTLLDASHETSIQHAKMLILAILWAENAELPVLIGDDLLSAIHGESIRQ